MRIVRQRLWAAVLFGFVLMLLAMPRSVAAARATAPAPTAWALFRLDPLGIPDEIVDQLERILRVELERAVGRTLLPRATIDKAVAANPRLATCTADAQCLAPLGRLIGAGHIVAGNVGGLADSYVVNLKLLEEGREIRRVAATLRGSPSDLIDEIRVAAFRLVAPERLVGQVAVLSDVANATVEIDERSVGLTPLPSPIAGLTVGIHQLAVTRAGFSDYRQEVPVRFEKTTQVVVHQLAVSADGRPIVAKAQDHRPWYRRWYVVGGIALGAVATGLVIGFTIPKQTAHACVGVGCP